MRFLACRIIHLRVMLVAAPEEAEMTAEQVRAPMAWAYQGGQHRGTGLQCTSVGAANRLCRPSLSERRAVRQHVAVPAAVGDSAITWAVPNSPCRK